MLRTSLSILPLFRDLLIICMIAVLSCIRAGLRCTQAKLYEETYDKDLYGRTGFCGLLGERVRLRHHHAQAIRRLLKEVCLVDRHCVYGVPF